MSKKLFFSTLFVLALSLSGTVRAGTPIVVDNFSFEYDIYGKKIVEQTNITDVKAWDIRDMSADQWATAWHIVIVGWGWAEGYDPVDGDCFFLSATTDLPDYPVEIYQILNPNLDADAIIVENRRYTFTFDALNLNLERNPEVDASIFYSAGGTEGEGNDVTLANKLVELTWPPWGEPDYAGWEEIKVTYAALAGANSIGERLGVKFRIPQVYPWLEGMPVVIDNVRVKWSWASDSWEPNPPDGTREVPTDVTLSWNPGLWPKSTGGHEVYFGTSWAEVNDADTGSDVFQGALDTTSWSVLIPYPEGLELGQTYFWRVDEVNEAYDGTSPPPPPDGRWKGEVWSFRVTGYALNPSPFDGATGVPLDVVLSWTGGTGAVSHDVYFGSSWDDVNSGTGTFKSSQSSTTWDAGANEELDLSATYYWRIDEISERTLKGDIWRFRAADFLILDDFESYASISKLRDVWSDYSTNPSTGAMVTLETEISLSGNSIKFSYCNLGYNLGCGYYYYSEVEADTADLAVGSDWTRAAVRALVLPFYGDPDNTFTSTDGMYVGLEDSRGAGSYAEVRYDDMNDILLEKWQEWNIDLDDFSGVDLNDVRKIYIGFGDREDPVYSDAIGAVILDDISLYPTRCVPQISLGEGDSDGDCVVDDSDLAVMAKDWLLGDYDAVPTIPETDPVVWYRLDDNSGTSVGSLVENSGSYGESHDIKMGTMYDNDGLTYIDSNCIPSWTTDVAPALDQLDPNYALDFSGLTDFTGDYLDLPALNLNSNTVTITAWIKPGPGIQGGNEFTWESGYTGLVNCRIPNTTAGLHYGGDAWGTWGFTGMLAYTWNDDDEATWSWDPGFLIPEEQWSFIAVAIEPTKATLCMSDGTNIEFAENVIPHVPEEFDGRTRIGSDPPKPEDEEVYDPFHCFRGLMDDVRIYNVTLNKCELMALAGAEGPIYMPLESPANPYDKEPPYSKYVNLRDYCVMAGNWLEQVPWP